MDLRTSLGADAEESRDGEGDALGASAPCRAARPRRRAVHGRGVAATPTGAAATVGLGNGRALVERVEGLAARVLARWPAPTREEAVQEVAFKLVRLWRRGGGPKIDADEYVATMLRNQAASLHRQEARRRAAERSLAARAAHVPVGTAAAEVSAAGAASGVAAALQRVAASALAGRRKLKERLEADIAELVALATQALTIDDAIRREGGGEGADPARREACRNRLHKRHERARRALRAAIDELERAGEVEPDEAGDLRALCEHLVRRGRRG
jgi:hypothetical protein